LIEARAKFFLKVGADTVALIAEAAGCLPAFLIGAKASDGAVLAMDAAVGDAALAHIVSALAMPSDFFGNGGRVFV
jgi:hypothetical protein